jgi:translocator protein
VVVVFAAASFGAAFKPADWYVALAKPTWAPPNWLFAPVWTILYFMIAIAGWMAWHRSGTGFLLLWVSFAGALNLRIWQLNP